MKRFLRFAALLSALALLGACDDDMYVTPLEVTNNNIAGITKLNSSSELQTTTKVPHF